MASRETKNVEEMNYFELLAWLGIGSSHPGGFPATKENLSALQIYPEDFILDAGCGSGLTACYLAKTSGCKILGVDINPQMIEKARLRAKKEGVSHLVEFKVADVYHLPFDENSFDWIITESVTVFLDKIKVYQEFYRILKPEGRVADLEMSVLKNLPDHLRNEMQNYFGPGTNPLTFEEWCNALSEAGFRDVEIINPQPLKNRSNVLMNELKKDWILVKDLANKASSQPGLIGVLKKNANFVKKNYNYFGFGLIYGRKPTPEKLGFKDWLKKFLHLNRD